jgi:ABC-type multidrug transport system permease subunit
MGDPAVPEGPGPKRSATHGLRALIGARVKVFLREPAVIFWVFAFPALLALALGLAFRDQPPEPARVGLATDRMTNTSDAQVLAILEASSAISLEKKDRATLEERLRKGGIDIIIDWNADTTPVFDYHFDAQRAEGRLARLVVDDVVQAGLGRRDVAELRERTDMPRGARYIDFLMPGLIAMNLMSSALWGVGYGMVQERSKKLMRRFATTPLSKTEFLGSYVISRLMFLAVEVAFLIGFGALVFDVTIQGNVGLFFLVSLIGVLSFTGFAVLCAARTASVEVVSGFINALTLPMWLLSGTFFSYERFPEALHPLIQLLPLTALNDALRAITNDGAGLLEVAPQLGVLAGWGLLAFFIGVRLFRWK